MQNSVRCFSRNRWFGLFADVGIVLLLTAAVGFGSRTCAADKPVSYAGQVAPLLKKYCSGCHSGADAESGLSLTTVGGIRTGGKSGPVLNEKSPADSLLLQVLLSRGDDQMPPADEPQPNEAERNTIQHWINSGAVFDGSAKEILSLPQVPVTVSHVTSPVFALAVQPVNRNSEAQNGVVTGTFKRLNFFRENSFPDGRKTESETDKSDLTNAAPTATFEVADGKVLDLSVSGEEILVATGIPGFSGRAIRFRAADGQVLQEYSGHSDVVYAAEFSPDGRLVVTAGYDRRIRIYNTEDGQLQRELTGHNGAIFDVTFSPDGQLVASASADATVKVWSVATGERLDTMSQPLAEQYSVIFSPDGRTVLAAGADSRIRRWKLESRNTVTINPLLDARFAHEGTIRRLIVSDDGQLLATSAEDGTIKTWRADDLTELSVDRLKTGFASALAFASSNTDGRQLLAGISSGSVLRYTVPDPTSAETASLEQKPHPETSASVPSQQQSPEVLAEMTETEPNDRLEIAQVVSFPSVVSGVIHSAGTQPVTSTAKDSASAVDVDYFKVAASAGQQMVLEIHAARDKSPLDSKIEVLTADGKPVLHRKLQAIRDSYFTFRGKDSVTVDDFRMFNWQEMDLNQYLYADGEVMRLWLYPRGPDSGFKVYPGFGQRYTYFGTTATAHPLQGPAFIVVPYEPEERIVENGLPVFPVYYENDDDPLRENGTDSRMIFQAPADGDYVVRVTDARGFSGSDFRYKLTLRTPRPDFQVVMDTQKVSVFQGTGKELTLTATRIDGYEGPIEIVAENLPEGISASLPTGIQAEQKQCFISLNAAPNAGQPSADMVKQIRFLAKAVIAGREVVHEIGGLTELTVSEKPKVQLTIHTPEQAAAGDWSPAAELTVYAGEISRAVVRSQRNDFTGHIEVGKEMAGRNMPHGAFVDNIGLNGLMILEGQNEREFFIRVASWVPEQSRTFFLKSNVDGITSHPVVLNVRKRPSDDADALRTAGR
ncbi:MAG: c-type cytochrome domain-containing protein [Planctomyces sp.]